ncbi:MAG: hypothetical protein D3925_01955 [Candidatus Electrothrix sp. AR5]|nr:hypothetical protein [Candidatus Electrothrix sp. AR5]
MFTLRKKKRFDILELKKDLFTNTRWGPLDDKCREELLDKLCRAVLKGVLVDNYRKFGELEKRMLQNMMKSSDTPLEDIEHYLRKNIRLYDHAVENALNDYYTRSREYEDLFNDNSIR